MKKIERKTLNRLGLTLALSGAMVMTGCGASASSSVSSAVDASASSVAASGDVQTILVGIGNGWRPFCYLDEDGNEDGYEYQVLKAVDELLPQYEFEFEPLDFTNVLVSLDSGKVDLAAHTFTLNPERQEKYSYTEETHYQNVVRFVVSKDNDSVYDINDLAGEPVLGVLTDATTQELEAYNEANPDKALDLQYANYSFEQTVEAISNGSLTAWFCNPNVLQDLNDNYGDKLKFANGEPALVTNSVFYAAKGNEQLTKDIDEALKTLKADGTLTKLSEEYLGDDYSGTVDHSGVLAEK